ncbi:MAG: WXG100 family type VII secretion target [Verrucomicrobiota bacterium]
MAKAIMDPDEVRSFANELKKFHGNLQTNMTSLQAKFGGLADSWEDQEHQKFSEEFQEAMKTLRRFVNISNQYAPYLLRKAQHIEDYLNQR